MESTVEKNDNTVEDKSAAEPSDSAETAQGPGPADRQGDVVDCCDPEFSSSEFQLVAYEQSGRGQHYLTIRDNEINVNGNHYDPYTKLKLHITSSDLSAETFVVVIEGIEATENSQPSLVSINKQNNKLELVHMKYNIARIREVPREVLFVMKYKGERVYFQAYGEDKELLIRFNEKGLPAPPTGGERGSIFSIV